MNYLSPSYDLFSITLFFPMWFFNGKLYFDIQSRSARLPAKINEKAAPPFQMFITFEKNSMSFNF